tara:strand:- start:4597 stop:6135 length:1539 start_codon:yes stop_codon:yes gene_type:complete
MQTSFKSLGVADEILNALEAKGYTSPTPIQAAVIPQLLKPGSDVMGQARTGTGKTAAFGIPLLQRCDPSIKSVQALVLAPTRELAMQVCSEMQSMQGKKKLKLALLYGGAAMSSQIQALKAGAHIAVGTPGRVLDHIRSGRLSLDDLQFLVLDEADRMLDMGFQEELEAIVESAGPERQTLMFSATFTPEIRKAASTYMKEYQMVKAEDTGVSNSNARMVAYEVYGRDKREALRRILHTSEDFYGLIFCARKSDVDDLAQFLAKKGFSAEGLHGDMSQPAREKVLGRLKKRKLHILVATDVAARGIDINDLGYVINYDMPDSADALTHRTGRTARAGRTGTSICLITPSEASRFRALEKRTGLMHERLPLPDRETVSKARLETARSAVERGVGNNPTPEYEEFARELLQNHSAEDLVSSLLRDRFRDMLLESSIPEISVPSPSSEKSGRGKNRGEGKSGKGNKKSGSRDGFRASRKSANRKRKYSGSSEKSEGSSGSSGRRGKLKKSGAGRR